MLGSDYITWPFYNLQTFSFLFLFFGYSIFCLFLWDSAPNINLIQVFGGFFFFFIIFHHVFFFFFFFFNQGDNFCDLLFAFQYSFLKRGLL